MKVIFSTIILCICFFIGYSCSPKEIALPTVDTIDDKSQTFILQPFSDISLATTDSLYQKIKKINPKTILKQPIPLPKNTYYKPRDRYRADSLIKYLWNKDLHNTVIIGLTNEDISITKGKYQDWGIMGLAYCPGYSCIISTFRLSQNNLDDQLYKITIHELGHTQGLLHCETGDKSCYMLEAQGKSRTDRLTHFCVFCKYYLEEKGWILE